MPADLSDDDANVQGGGEGDAEHSGSGSYGGSDDYGDGDDGDAQDENNIKYADDKRAKKSATTSPALGNQKGRGDPKNKAEFSFSGYDSDGKADAARYAAVDVDEYWDDSDIARAHLMPRSLLVLGFSCIGQMFRLRV